MNYSIDWSFLDIAYPERKVYIEYDGSGHNQSVKLKKMSVSVFEEREAKRTKRLLRKGWKGIRIISTKDYLPTDGMILKQVHEGIRTLNNGSDFFEIDIDKGQIRDGKGIYNADFGELRQQRENNAVTTEIYIGDDVDTAGSSVKAEDEDTV